MIGQFACCGSGQTPRPRSGAPKARALTAEGAGQAVIGGLAKMPVAVIIAMFLENAHQNWMANWPIAAVHPTARRQRSLRSRLNS